MRVACSTVRGAEPLSISRQSRTISTPIGRALQARDQGCRFPGCGHTRFLHAHHIQHWAHGGETSIENLVTICSYHHQLLHEGGYSVQRIGRSKIRFRTPRGKEISEAAPQVTGTAKALVQDNGRQGIHVSAATGHSGWDGTPIDYEHTMFVLMQPTLHAG